MSGTQLDEVDFADIFPTYLPKTMVSSTNHEELDHHDSEGTIIRAPALERRAGKQTVVQARISWSMWVVSFKDEEMSKEIEAIIPSQRFSKFVRCMGEVKTSCGSHLLGRS